MARSRRRRLLSEATTRAALASVATALLLLALKGYAAWQTSSVALLGSLADSGLDLLASLVTLYGVRLAATPADHDHRFGHGKAEALAALFQVALISASALAIGWRGVSALADPQPVEAAGIGIAVSAAAIAATMLLVAYQRRVIAATGSVAVKADSVHYQGDILLNLAVIAALLLDRYAGVLGADAVFGLAIAAWLGWGAFKASAQAIDELMDKEWPETERQDYLAVAAGAHPELRGIHDFRTRRAGNRSFAQFHMVVAREMSVAEAHDVVEAVESELHTRFPRVEVLIHLDPEGHVDTDDPLVEEDVTPHWFRKRI
ncbi:cation diffusion facilitator family transporter [Sphingomonas baiyangensis]|uniref:Cation diffusion facilitator family transporter n=1 Tax=Sphingomonas baiyangensis TaxID=2572576 RepID=A0A4U1L5X2_9SPHN|nr:cation diffusion facilitator family transporter [Sphingomonas baiyangensis]TKD52349.1 cation diffusion facilitator family transporter [Sphingomonas baiyangensis]